MLVRYAEGPNGQKISAAATTTEWANTVLVKIQLEGYDDMEHAAQLIADRLAFETTKKGRSQHFPFMIAASDPVCERVTHFFDEVSLVRVHVIVVRPDNIAWDTIVGVNEITCAQYALDVMLTWLLAELWHNTTRVIKIAGGNKEVMSWPRAMGTRRTDAARGQPVKFIF